MNRLSVFSPLVPMLNDVDDFFAGMGTNDYKMNVQDNGDEFIITVAAAGFKEDDFNVGIENGVVTISAEFKNDIEQNENGQVIRREYLTRSFSRIFTLPSMVDSESAEAFYENGVLTLKVKKAESAKARKISVLKK